MSDSRIAVAMAEVAAAIELLADARTTMSSLLHEDPAFSQTVQDYLRLSRRELLRADIAATESFRALRDADSIENRRTA